MTVYLSAQQVLFIHARLIAETGGAHGVRDLALLESAVARPAAIFGGADLYEKAAALMESLALNHPFVDGNKRTAITAASLFLLRNGQRIVADNATLERFTLSVVIERPGLDAVANWFREHTEPLG